MANSIEYIYQVIDRYSAPLNRITQSTNRFKNRINLATKAIDKFGSKLERLPISMRNFKRTIGSPVFQSQISNLKDQTGGIARNIDRMSKASSRFAITSKALRAGNVMSSAIPKGGQMGSRFAGAGGAVAGFGAAIGGAAIAGGMFNFAKSASDISDAMADVARATNLSGPKLEAMQQQLQKLGRATGRSALGLAAMAYEGGKIGIANNELVPFVQTVLKTATAFDIADAEAGAAISSIRAKLQMSVSSVDELMQRVNYLADNTAANGRKMVDVIARTSVNFQMLKMDPATIAGWAAFADQVSVSSELAASGLNMMLNRVNKIPGLTQKMLKDPKNALIDYLKQFEKIPEAVRGAAIEKVFGTEAGRIVKAAVANSELLRTSMDKAASSKALGSMDREFSNILKRSSTAAKRLKETFSDISRAIGRVFLRVFDKYSKRLIEMSEWVLSFVKSHPGLVKIAMVMGSIAVAVASVVVPMGILMSMIGSIGLPILAVIGGITAIVAAFTAMYNESEALRNALRNFWDASKPIFEGLKILVIGLANVISKAFGDGQSIKTWGDAVAVVINTVANSIRLLIMHLKSLRQYWADLFTGDWGKIIGQQKDLLGSLYSGLFEKLGIPMSQQKAASRQDNKMEVSGQIGVSATNGAKVESANINLNQGSNLAMMGAH